jgi:4a-hydroxytetrahydrobiopterin dehydratase
MGLADQQCIPCRGGVPPLASSRVAALLKELGGGWKVNTAGHLERAYDFKDFKAALEFANAVGEIAEQQGHHPDLYVRWGECRVEIWTHKISWLTESDFYLAAKIGRVSAK